MISSLFRSGAIMKCLATVLALVLLAPLPARAADKMLFVPFELIKTQHMVVSVKINVPWR